MIPCAPSRTVGFVSSAAWAQCGVPCKAPAVKCAKTCAPKPVCVKQCPPKYKWETITETVEVEVPVKKFI